MIKMTRTSFTVKNAIANVRLNGKVHANLDHPFFKDFEYLKSVTPEGGAKQTIPSRV